MRKLVTIRKINEIHPIKDADAIETAVLGGWSTVVKKNEFNVGDSVLYFEIDTFLPETVKEFAFLSERSRKTVPHPETYDEVSGHVLKSMKLRGVISQGLILPIDFGLNQNSTQTEVDETMNELGVFKYEPPLPSGGEQVGQFPKNARKTDAERVQNLTNDFLNSLGPEEWEATEKIDGTSATFVKDREGVFTVASRNWEVSFENSLQGQIAQKLNLPDIMPNGSIIQGEIYGEGIQGNKLKVSGTHLAVFAWKVSGDIENQEFVEFIDEHSVPELDVPFPKTLDEALEQVHGMKSLINPKVQAEGIVWWNKDDVHYEELENRPNFKVINNKFLLKNQ